MEKVKRHLMMNLAIKETSIKDKNKDSEFLFGAMVPNTTVIGYRISFMEKANIFGLKVPNMTVSGYKVNFMVMEFIHRLMEKYMKVNF